VIAAYRGTGYNVVLFLHILAVFVAIAPGFVHPLLARQSEDLGGRTQSALIGMFAANGRRIYAPALLLTGLLGFALQGMSDGVITFGQTWFWLAIVLWVLMNAVQHAVVMPAERAVGHGRAEAALRMERGGAVLSVLFLVTLYLMVFQPGA
jgi:uncharacterized membrane protein